MNDPLLRPTATRPEVEARRAERRRRERAEGAERCRLALVAALHLPPETTWEEALARVVPVPAEVPAEPTAKGCHGCAYRLGQSVACVNDAREVRLWIDAHLGPDLLTPKPGAPECPGRIER